MNQDIASSTPTKTPRWIGMVQGAVITVCFMLGSVQIDPAKFPVGNVEGTGWGWGFAAVAGFCAGSLRGVTLEQRNIFFLSAAALFLGWLVIGICMAGVAKD